MTGRAPGGSSLSIVLPCLDEAERLPGTLAAYLAHFPPSGTEVELLVVDDGSTDGTTVIADQIAAADPRVRVVRTTRNHGKGYAVRTGIQAAQGELVVFTDADGSYGPEQLERVVAALAAARSLAEGSVAEVDEDDTDAPAPPAPPARRQSARSRTRVSS